MSHTSEAPPPRHVAGPSLSPPPRIPPSPLSPAPLSPGRAGCGADAARGGVKLQSGQVPAGRKGRQCSQDSGKPGRSEGCSGGSEDRLGRAVRDAPSSLLPSWVRFGTTPEGRVSSPKPRPGAGTGLGGSVLERFGDRSFFLVFWVLTGGGSCPGPRDPPPPLRGLNEPFGR